MKGDFSRLRLPLQPTDSGVWLQQGRPLLDSDWNAATALFSRQLRQLAEDVIGRAGGPPDAGFAIRPHCELLLNQSPPHETPGRQFLWLRHSHSLPFRCAELMPAASDGDTGAMAVLDWEDHGDRDRPYLLQLGLTVPRGRHGTLLCRPGHVAVWMDAERRLHLGTPEHDEDIPTIAVWDSERPFSLTLAHTGRRYVLALNGQEVRQWTPARPPRWPVHVHAPALVVACSRPDGEHSEGDFLACGLDALRVWRAPMHHHDLHAHLSHGREPAWRLVCALDFSQLRDHELWDRSGHDNRGHVSGVLGPRPIVTDGLRIGAGRYWVEGMPCVNGAECDYRHQPFRPGTPTTPSAPVSLLYLEAWERFVTALERPSLREPALGGPDTTGRTETVWQVRCIEGRDRTEVEDRYEQVLSAAAPGTMRLWVGTQLRAGNDLFRIEIHNTGWARSQPLTDQARHAMLRATILDPATGQLQVDGAPALPVGAPVLVSIGGDSLETTVARQDGPGALRLAALPQAAATNREAWLLPLASFKWSRDNGAVAFAVQALTTATDPSGDTIGRVRLAGVGFNGMNLSVGDLMEMTDEADALDGRPGSLHSIVAFSPDRLEVDVSPAPSEAAVGRRILRRWDGHATVRIDPTGLEDGLSAAFSADGPFRTGEYWSAALRATTDPYRPWPLRDGEPEAVRPSGTTRRHARLAVVTRSAEGVHCLDLRHRFTPLAELGGVGLDSDTAHWLKQMRQWTERSELDLGGSIAAVVQAQVAATLDTLLPELLARHQPPAPHAASEHAPAPAHHAAPSWRALPPGPGDRVPAGRGRAALADGRLVFVGDGAHASLSWDPALGGWGQPLDLPQVRTSFWLEAAGDTVIMGGGITGEASTPAPGIAVLRDGAWTAGEATLAPVMLPGTASDGRILYVSGGFSSTSRQMVADVVRIDAATLTATDLPPLPAPRSLHAAAVMDGALWIMGGRDAKGRELDDVQVLDLNTGQWSEGPRLPYPCYAAEAAATPLGLVLAGGWTPDPSGAVSHVLLLRPGSGGWHGLAPMNNARCLFGLAASGLRLLAVGGFNGGGNVTGGESLSLDAAQEDRT